MAKENGKKNETKVTRREFLKVLGAGSAAGVAGCADSARQNVFPYVKGEDEQIPGVAVWYNSTCRECAAGCGIQVRTREGRAVKIEGNPDHPVNRGGVCAMGHSALQHLYDPDRVREPLEKQKDDSGKEVFRPISWQKALAKVSALLKKNKSSVFLSGSESGSRQQLLQDWCEAAGSKLVQYSQQDQEALAQASELVYGYRGIPEFTIEKADTVLSFGADFLETWVSPVQFAKGWAQSRKSKHPLNVIHIEPRLSLTGSNADLWLKNKPGSDLALARLLIKMLLEKGKGKNLREGILVEIEKQVSDLNPEKIAAESGVSLKNILLIVEKLYRSKNSLILAGGSSSLTDDSIALQSTIAFLNLILGNVGKTVDPSQSRPVHGNAAQLADVAKKMKDAQYELAFVHNVNPVFEFPSTYGIRYALKAVRTVVSFSSHLDETSQMADLILPTHTPLESWGDIRDRAGTYSLQQPTMAPVFNTRDFGDLLISLTVKPQREKVTGNAENFEGYLQLQWQEVHREAESSIPFKKFWLQSVEAGGYFKEKKGEAVRVTVGTNAVSRAFRTEHTSDNHHEHSKERTLHLLPYPSVRSFDGRSANRPWLQELPDPVTKIVWDTWVEIHPDTAKHHGIAERDVVTVRNTYGEINVPVYLTEHVHPDVVAVPLGQGHTNYGRYADSVGGGNVLSLVPPQEDLSGGVALANARVDIKRGRGRSSLINTQGSDSQLGRELARSTFVGATAHAASGHNSEKHSAEDHGSGHGGGHAHHEPKQMYEQRGHPLYNWGMAVDLSACTGCSACVVACYAENNIAVVGKEKAAQGREMSWLRIERYYDGSAEELQVSFLPMMCQQCNNAPCEPVCPVYATYHNEEGLNAMVYNRCVGTRYCGNNCSYKVRRFNWHEYDWPEPLNWQLNPDVTKRTAGVMEKCTFCVQRITEGKDKAKDVGRPVQDGEIQPACVQSCPTDALTFGNLNDPESKVSKLSKNKHGYKILDHHINTQPSVTYLERKRMKV